MAQTQRSAASLLAPGKGVLVADEYVGAMLEPGGEQRSVRTLDQYVDLALATPRLTDWVSGVLLTADRFSAVARPGATAEGHAREIQLGVRMDIGLARPQAGFDAARTQLAGVREAGATFVEWRANLDPTQVAPGSSHVDAEALALGAAAAQGEQILPLLTIAMPDLASHTAAVSQAVTGNALEELFAQLARSGIDTSAVLLRLNMVVAGRPQPRTGNAGGRGQGDSRGHLAERAGRRPRHPLPVRTAAARPSVREPCRDRVTRSRARSPRAVHVRVRPHPGGRLARGLARRR